MRRSQAGRAPRHWRIPPAILRGPGEGIDRLGILEEHRELDAVLLWRLARDVEMWAATPPDRRANLFTPGRQIDGGRSELPEEVHTWIAELLTLLTSVNGDAPPADIGAACEALAQWAAAHGAKETAVAYAQAAALAVPEQPGYALLTGRCAEELGQHTRATTWYQRTVALARRGSDPVRYAAAFLSLASQAEAAQDPGRARRYAVRAFRSARRAGQVGGTEYARAAYFLFRLTHSAGAEEESQLYARVCTRRALRGDELAPASLLNLAEHWFAHRREVPTRRLLKLLDTGAATTPAQRLHAAVMRVRVEIAARAPLSARRALAHALNVAAESVPEDTERTLALLLQLARCAAVLGEREGFARAAKLALTQAPEERYQEVSDVLARLAQGRKLAGTAT